MLRLLVTSGLALACLFTTACGSTARVTVDLQGLAPLNVNDVGESTPVDVRFYPLSAESAFRTATVEDLWTQADQVLKSDLLAAPIVTTVQPGRAEDPARRFDMTVPKGTRSIGVLALYRRADARDRRSLVVLVSDLRKGPLRFTGSAVVHAIPEPKAAATEAAPAAANP